MVECGQGFAEGCSECRHTLLTEDMGELQDDVAHQTTIKCDNWQWWTFVRLTVWETLLLACENKQVELLKLHNCFRSHSIPTEVQTPHYLCMASHSRNHLEVGQMLLEAGADKGQSP